MRGFGYLLAALVLAATWVTGAQAQSSYRLQPGDVLRIEVLEDSSINRDVLISPDGVISLPLAGTVTAGGRTIDQVQATVAAQLQGSFTTRPTVFVGLQRLAEPEPLRPPGPAPEPETYAIYVLGEANNTGLIEVEPGTNVLQLFAQMGGFTNFAATKRIQLRRTGPDGQEVIYTLNYDAMEQGLSPNGRATVADGDVIVIPQRRLFE